MNSKMMNLMVIVVAIYLSQHVMGVTPRSFNDWGAHRYMDDGFFSLREAKGRRKLDRNGRLSNDWGAHRYMDDRFFSLTSRRKLDTNGEEFGLNPCQFDIEGFKEYNSIRAIGLEAYNSVVNALAIGKYINCAIAAKDQKMIEALGGGPDSIYYAEPWGECEGTCLNAKEERGILCLSTIDKAVLPDSSCANLPVIRPVSERNCLPVNCDIRRRAYANVAYWLQKARQEAQFSNQPGAHNGLQMTVS